MNKKTTNKVEISSKEHPKVEISTLIIKYGIVYIIKTVLFLFIAIGVTRTSNNTKLISLLVFVVPATIDTFISLKRIIEYVTNKFVYIYILFFIVLILITLYVICRCFYYNYSSITWIDNVATYIVVGSPLLEMISELMVNSKNEREKGYGTSE